MDANITLVKIKKDILVNNSIEAEIVFIPSTASNVPSGSFAIPKKANAKTNRQRKAAKINAL